MTILPLDPASNSTPDALRAFLTQCQAAAVKAGQPQLVSISLEVDALDPLAVLESIFEPGERHFYVERPAEQLALAGADAVVAFTAHGPGRFAECQRFIDRTLAHTIAVGDLKAPFAGPHFFAAFSFLDETTPGEAFEAASVFVPRWQVAQAHGRTIAVANLLLDGDSPVEAVTQRVWRARQKFGAFDYSAADFEARPVGPSAVVREVGPGDGYQQTVQRALDRIANDDSLRKVVLARAKDLEATQSFHPLRVLNGLRERFPECYAFSFANGRGQSFIGASPERLLSVSEGTLLTEALAGSTRRGSTASEDAALAGALARSDKDLREQRIVVDSIVRVLAPLGLEFNYGERPGMRRLANVQHLHTAMRAPMPGSVRLLDVLARLHPTPAVGGMPREAAIDQIRRSEPFPRGLYAGALGWIGPRGDGEFFVGLRSALVDGPNARLYAGAGIVAGSSPQNEFAETELKFKAMQEALLAP